MDFSCASDTFACSVTEMLLEKKGKKHFKFTCAEERAGVTLQPANVLCGYLTEQALSLKEVKAPAAGPEG